MQSTLPPTPQDPAYGYAAVTSVTETTGAEDRPLRWGPIWAGLLTAIGVFFMLTLLAAALGLQAVPGAPEEEEVGLAALLVTSGIALVSFFIGGFVSSWAGGISNPGRSLLNGFLVWALWLVLVFVLVAIGVGSLIGEAGGLFRQLTVEAPELEGQALIDALRSSTWQSFLALALTAAAAALGGVVGARDEVRTLRTTMIRRA
jgi:hypothetical protein